MKYPITIQRTKQSRINEVDFENIPFGKVFSDHMFVSDYRDGKWVDHRIVPFQNFTMHPASMALHYGQAIFEGMKASKNYEGKPMLFRPEMHARRLNASARRLMMPDLPEDLFLQGLHELISIDAGWIPPMEGSAMYIRPFMFATDEFFGVKPSKTYRFCIFTGPVGPYYDRPVSLYADTEYVRAVPGGTGEAKAAGNYAGALLPTEKAIARGFDQVMWLDGKEFKYVQEVGTMNIFFVIDGVVVTPQTDGAILKGITRESIIHILKEKGFQVEVRPLAIDELVEASKAGKLEEAFGTGTAAVVARVSKIQYQDVVMKLPEAGPESVGAIAKREIDGLRSGRIEDTHGWVVPVKSEATVDA